MRFGGLSYVMKHQILLKLAEWHPGAMNCQYELKLVCGNREFPFLELSKITCRTGRICNLEGIYYVIQNQILLKLAEWHPGAVDCQFELKLVCENREFYLLWLSKIKDKTGNICVFGGIFLCNATPDSFETVTPWGSWLSIRIETGLWKHGVSFLDLSKIKNKTCHIWGFEGF